MSSDQDSDAPLAKKPTKQTSSETKKRAPAKAPTPAAKKQKPDGKENTADKKNTKEKDFDLGGKKRLRIAEFKGQLTYNIREYYEKDGEFLPGKKGICLNKEQFKILIRSGVDALDNDT